MSTTPKITIDLGVKSVVEFANLAPHLTNPAGWFMTSLVRQLDKNCARRFEVEVAAYPIDRAKVELDLEAERFADRMARVPAVAARIRSLVEQGEKSECPFEIARLVQQVQDAGSNVFLR